MSQSITSENLALAIVKYVAAKALPVLEPNLFMARLVNRDFEATLAQAGDTINVPVAPRMVANNIAETGTVTAQQLSLGNIPVTLNSHIESTFTIPDVSKALSAVGLAETFMQPAMLALAEKIELDLLNLTSLFTYNAVQGASNTPITEAVVDSIETTFFKSRVPAVAPKILACSADVYATARSLPRFSEMQTIGNSDAITNGEFGKLKNITFMRSQLIQPVSSTTTNLAFTPDAIALVVRKLDLPFAGQGTIGAYADYNNISLRVLMSYNPNSLGQQFTVDVLYGAAALRNQFGMQVLS